MAPGDDELDDEIRGHLAITIKERIEQGEDPEAARLAALREFGNVTLTRDSIRSVWRPRWAENAGALARDLRFALRAMLRVKGLAATVIVTLALGIGANAAIFSVVRGVLLRPLANRDEDRLVYIRQSRPGVDNITFSIPEIDDFKKRVLSVRAFGDFSTTDMTLVGFGNEPRLVKAGVVSGTFFDVMGLRPVLGRLIDARDDGSSADGAAVLTYRFWTTSLNRNPGVIGQTIRLGPNSATVVGVLEPSVPYPADTEIIANVVTSPHHMGATMQTRRDHRMTDLFARLKPGVSIESARAELTAVHAAIMRENPKVAPKGVELTVTRLRDQIAAPARTILILLLLTAAVVFVIACSNVANLILARSVHREGELAVRAALGAGTGALRRTLLAESLLLCGAGAVFGIGVANPLVAMVSRYAARFSIRALDVGVDATVIWVGAALAIGAAILLAYVPRLPSAHASGGLGLAAGSVRLTPGTNRRLRLFAITQIACSFVLLAGAGTLLATLLAMRSAQTAYSDLTRVLAIDIPAPALGSPIKGGLGFFRETVRRIGQLPGVQVASIGTVVPWRDAGQFGGGSHFKVEGYTPANGEEDPFGTLRIVGPRFFATLGITVLEGREFADDEREPVAIVSRSVAQRLFPNGEALNHHVWAEFLMGPATEARRIVGIVADVDDERVIQRPGMTVYLPVSPMIGLMGGRLFVRSAAADPYSVVPAVTKIVRELAPDQPVERTATLEDVRATVLAPERVNAFVFSGFAGIALLIAVVGVASVLAFSVSARTREFGVRLAVGSAPSQLVWNVVSEGFAIAAIGIAAGAAGGYALARVAARFVVGLEMPGALPAASAAVVLIGAAVFASLMPAARASGVDVLQALRSE